jgi:hypothetical protein
MPVKPVCGPVKDSLTGGASDGRPAVYSFKRAQAHQNANVHNACHGGLSGRGPASTCAALRRHLCRRARDRPSRAGQTINLAASARNRRDRHRRLDDHRGPSGGRKRLCRTSVVTVPLDGKDTFANTVKWMVLPHMAVSYAPTARGARGTAACPERYRFRFSSRMGWCAGRREPDGLSVCLGRHLSLACRSSGHAEAAQPCGQHDAERHEARQAADDSIKGARQRQTAVCPSICRAGRPPAGKRQQCGSDFRSAASPRRASLPPD